ncbi:MAG: response regulator transcription factor [Verrucomicrobiota bacterium]
MSDDIRILIVEDNKPYATTLQKLLETGESMSHVETFFDGESCLAALADQDYPKVDIIILDLQLPGIGGLAIIPRLKQLIPNLRILVLTHNDDHLTTLEAIRLGATGYVLKTASVQSVWNAIHEIHEGGCVIDPSLSSFVLKALTSTTHQKQEFLSEREQQVLELLAAGYVKKEIADQLSISYSSVATHTERIFSKLKVRNIASAVATAIRKGLID